MVSERDEESAFPLTPIRYNKNNRSNQSNLTNLINDKLLRSNFSFYLSKNLNSAWRQYCRLSGKDGCWLVEEALLEYMKGHPLPQVSLSVTQDLAAYAPDVRDRLRNKIIKEKIRNVVATIRRVQVSGRGEVSVFKKQLQKLVLQATNLKKPDSELLELLRDVENLL
jgi:hypothetical protein